jgi:DNA replication and repair protein RecF
MAEHAVAIAAARLDALDALRAVIENRRLREDSVFPWAEAAIDGALEASVAEAPAVEVEDQYMRQLRESRERDRAARRTLTGPHASDFAVIFGPKDSPARICSTGEQKALLIGLILAQAEMIKSARGGEAPIILLDEIIAHLDERRREALFSEIFRLDSQAWMTGTEPEPFAALAGKAQFLHVADGAVTQSKAAAPASAAIKRRMRAT